jgi:hypothetical protein
LENRRGKQVLPSRRSVTTGRGEVAGRVERGWVGGYGTKKCVHMYVNAKMIPIETTLRMGGGGG